MLPASSQTKSIAVKTHLRAKY